MTRRWLFIAAIAAISVLSMELIRFLLQSGQGMAVMEQYQGDGYQPLVPLEIPASALGVGAVHRAASSPEIEFRHRDVVPNLVIRNGHASIQVDSLDPAVIAVRRLAERVGGYLANVTQQLGDYRVRSATIELRFPAARFDDAIGGLAPIGKVESVTIGAEDVSEEFVDVTARTENARRLERRLIQLLAARTGKLSDVLAVEQALARVREEIERHEGRLRYLHAHAAVSRLTIHVHEPEPLIGHRGRSVIGEAFAQAWRNFVWLAALVVASLGIVIPLGGLALTAWLVAKRRSRVAA